MFDGLHPSHLHLAWNALVGKCLKNNPMGAASRCPTRAQAPGSEKEVNHAWRTFHPRESFPRIIRPDLRGVYLNFFRDIPLWQSYLPLCDFCSRLLVFAALPVLVSFAQCLGPQSYKYHHVHCSLSPASAALESQVYLLHYFLSQCTLSLPSYSSR